VVILHAASEVVGFAKTGGLADVTGSLPRALARRGHQCLVILPLYQCARHSKIPIQPTDNYVTVPIGHRSQTGRLWRSTLPDSNVPVYLIEQSDYFDRDNPSEGRGLYQFTLPNGQKWDYQDNAERFIFFARAVLESLRFLDAWPQLLHNHDWQAGLVPVYLNEVYRKYTPEGLRPHFEQMRSVFTIHNIAYQGQFRSTEFPLSGLDWKLFNFRQLEFYGQLNLLKAGIVFSDWITTVSPRYAQEIQTPYYGYGLQGVLGERRDRLTGIVNGTDYAVWDPATDRHLAANYNADTVTQGKPLCKAALQRRYGLPEDRRAPVLSMVARLAEQKGIDLVGKSADSLLHSTADCGLQLIVLGEGEPAYHRMLQDLRNRHSQRVGLTLAFDEPLAHQIEAGADIFLMPSLFEPSGLNQLYSLKYGTVPVVRACGGLADTIVDCTPATLADGTATGFSFVPYTPAAFLATIHRALDIYRNQPDTWLQLQRNGMRQDWSWDRSAAEYEKVYSKLVQG
jgi:starch synthase